MMPDLIFPTAFPSRAALICLPPECVPQCRQWLNGPIRISCMVLQARVKIKEDSRGHGRHYRLQSDREIGVRQFSRFRRAAIPAVTD
jgi:hypothetical protein